MQCSKCHRDAIVFQPYSGMHLCGQHLVADVEAKAKKMIRAQGWLRPGDHIAVLLSGDPGSSALLYFLKHLTAQRHDIRISAITVADGTGAGCDISRAKRVAASLDTELIEVPLAGDSGTGTGAATGSDPDCASTPPFPPFPPSRSFLPGSVAQQHGITKIAWGLCLDDAAGVVLGSILRGAMDVLVRGNSHEVTIHRICPFISVTAAEVSLYAALCGFPGEQPPCPAPGDELHKDTVALLERYTGNHPATKYALLNLGENLAGSPIGIAGLIQACEWIREHPGECCDDRPVPCKVNNGAT